VYPCLPLTETCHVPHYIMKTRTLSNMMVSCSHPSDCLPIRVCHRKICFLSFMRDPLMSTILQRRESQQSHLARFSLCQLCARYSLPSNLSSRTNSSFLLSSPAPRVLHTSLRHLPACHPTARCAPSSSLMAHSQFCLPSVMSAELRVRTGITLFQGRTTIARDTRPSTRS
jgi:hypothetical protein